MHKALAELATVQQGLQSKEAAFDQLREQLHASEGNLQTLRTARDALQVITRTTTGPIPISYILFFTLLVCDDVLHVIITLPYVFSYPDAFVS